jgi:hypothetical protein
MEGRERREGKIKQVPKYKQVRKIISKPAVQ